MQSGNAFVIIKKIYLDDRRRRNLQMKKPFVTLEQAKKIIETYPTPFHIYDEKGIRENARKVNAAFSWNKGFREYFAVKATPTPAILQILKEEGCGADCSFSRLRV